MNKDDAITNYLKIVPEIEECFKIQCQDSFIDDTDGAYVVWGLGIMPCVIKLINNYDENISILERTFDFFEEMASSDEEVRELLLYSVLEKLGDDKKLLNVSMAFMGKNTLKYFEQVENFMGR